MTLGRWLAHALEHGQVRRDGAGTKTKPYRYWVKEREKMFGLGGVLAELDVEDLLS